MIGMGQRGRYSSTHLGNVGSQTQLYHRDVFNDYVLNTYMFRPCDGHLQVALGELRAYSKILSFPQGNMKMAITGRNM